MICRNRLGRQEEELQSGQLSCKRYLVGSVSEGTRPSFPESESKGGEKYFLFLK